MIFLKVLAYCACAVAFACMTGVNISYGFNIPLEVAITAFVGGVLFVVEMAFRG